MAISQGPRRPVRLKDVAADLGVSLMTVSRALRNHPDIGEETRLRVLKRVEELNYQPDWMARGMVTGRSYLVGLVIPDLMHSFFAEIAMAVSAKLMPLGYQVVIANTEEQQAAEERHVHALLGRKVDGLILASAYKTARGPMFRAIAANGVPLVLIDRMVKGAEASYAGSDDVGIGELATEHLIEEGCRRIAHIQGPALSTGRGRLEGFRAAMQRAGLAVDERYVVPGDISDTAGYDAMRVLLALPEPPDGVFCYSDPVAAGAMKAITEAGLSIPGDIAIVGAGNVHYSDLLRVSLSTVDQGSSMIGQGAADLLVRAMEDSGANPRDLVLVGPKLIIRNSSRR